MLQTSWHIKTSLLSHARFAVSCFAFLICALSVASPAQAELFETPTSADTSDFAPSACDPNYYESLESRAWLEAQREITQNQNLIFKPDSVLEYTCFDRHLGVLADQSGNAQATGGMFSETGRWDPRVLGNNQATHMDDALTRLVSQALNQYQQANFNHSFLGGRSSTSSTLQASVQPGAYNCNFMNQIWQEAKCMGFIDNATNDGFFTFEQYQSSGDKRFLPTQCTGVPVLWRNNINTAYEAPLWIADDVDTLLEDIFPETGCGDQSAGGSKIRTGLTVRRIEGEPKEYQEHICVAPGCYYQPTGPDSGNCLSDSGELVAP